MNKTSSKKPPNQGKGNRSAVKKISSARGKAPLTKSRSSAKGESKSSPSIKTSPGKTIAAKERRDKIAPGKPAPVIRRALTPEEIQYKKHVAQFENGVKLFSLGDLSKARDIFDHLAAISAQDLAQRARVYLNICNQRLSRPALRLKTADDFYNYAVSMANQGNQEEAELHLTKALKLSPKSDYIYYALATTHALRENVEAALENLQKAIQLNDRNRYLAQNDSDFANLGEDPRFTELIYPERPIS